MSEAIEFLDKMEVDHKSATPAEEVVRLCPECGNDNWKLYVNKKKGMFHCKVCGVKGNLFTLKTKYGVIENVASAKDIVNENSKPMNIEELDTMVANLWAAPHALEYLHSRGFKDETIKHFRLGYMKDEYNGEWIAIPHIHDNQLWNVKYRRFAGGDKQFKRVTGQPTMIFNIDDLDLSKGGVLIAEAELDAVAAWQMGVKNVVSLTAGADTFKGEWLNVFTKFKTVYVCLDSDGPGQKGARKIADKIGIAKVKNIVLPTKDINEFLLTVPNSSDEFKLLVGRAERFELESVGDATDIVSRLDAWFDGEDSGLIGVETGFPQLDNMTRGLKAEDLIIFSGDSGVGKTTFMLNIINELLQPSHDIPVFGFFLEGQLEYYFNRMLGMEQGIEYTSLRDDKETWEQTKKIASGYPFYYYAGSQGDLTVESLKEIVKAVVNLYDVRVIVLDNLQKLVGDSDPRLHQKVGETISMLKDLAVDLKITMLVISHIRKKDPDSPLITKHDAKSSSTIYQVCDQFLILQMIRGDYYVSIDKNRTGPDGISIKVDFDKAIGKFTETGELEDASSVASVPRFRG